MRLPQVHSPYAVILIAGAITLVVWLIVIWPGTDTRRPPVDTPAASTQQPITYFDMTIKDRSAQPAPPSAPATAP